jgi:hypothetical protein
MLKNLSAINTNCAEGRALMGALSIISTESQLNKEPDAILMQCVDLANRMYKGASALPESVELDRSGFEKELESLINRYSMESGSNTPDYILVEYMANCLNSFHQATRLRDNWYGGKRSVINDQAEKWAPFDICKCGDR